MSVTVASPANLRYMGWGFFADGTDTYSMGARNVDVEINGVNIPLHIPDSINLDPTTGFEVFTIENESFVQNGERLFALVSAPLSAGYDMKELRNFNIEELEVVGHNYIKDGQSVYSTFS